MKLTHDNYTPNVSDDMTEAQWTELENYLPNHLELDAEEINVIIYQMVAEGRTL